MKEDLIWIGIDQTGAVRSNGQPKPLPACALVDKDVHFFQIDHLDIFEIQSKLQSQCPSLKNELITSRFVLALDCVIGLPKSIGCNWNQAMIAVGKMNAYGRKPAVDFFRKLGANRDHHRKIELSLNANSLFREKPFQKNIQTGTFRFWKEISERRDQFFSPLLEKKMTPLQVPIFEGYPSYSWKVLFQTLQREPLKLHDHLLKHKAPFKWDKSFQAKIEKDANYADAFVLAYHLKKDYLKVAKLKMNPEGHILGFAESPA